MVDRRPMDPHHSTTQVSSSVFSARLGFSLKTSKLKSRRMKLRFSNSVSFSAGPSICVFKEMFRFVCKSLIQYKAKDSSYIRGLQTLPSLNSASDSVEKHSFTLSYLTKSCGLPLEKCISASKLINIENSTDKANSVLAVFTAHGFSKTDIVSLISRHPRLLLADADKTLRPKIEFFESLGIAGSDLAKIICSNRYILASSLKNQIIPAVDFLRGFLQTNENLVRALKQSTWVLRCNVKKVMLPNISVLRDHGVPEHHIARLIILQAQSLMLRIDLFEEVARKVKEMGFDPMKLSFIYAIRSMAGVGIGKWEKKRELFTSFGWSETEFNSAVRIQPYLMLCSEKKIRELMDFFVNKLGLKVSDVAKCPNLFLTSLEGRIIPRCVVLQVLMSKGLIRKDLYVVWVLIISKAVFEKKFLTQYKEDAPEVIKAYQGQIGFQGFNTEL